MLFVVDCRLIIAVCNQPSPLSISCSSQSVYVSLGYWQLWRNQEGVFNAPGIHSLFSMCPGVGRQLKVQTHTHTLPHALHGKSSEIKGFVCTANNKDCSQLATLPKRKDDSFFFKL